MKVRVFQILAEKNAFQLQISTKKNPANFLLDFGIKHSNYQDCQRLFSSCFYHCLNISQFTLNFYILSQNERYFTRPIDSMKRIKAACPSFVRL